MTTVINSPRGEDRGVGVIVTVLVIIVLVVLFFVYALPAIRNNAPADNNGSLDVNVNLPGDAGGTGGAPGGAGTGDGN